MSAPGMVPRRYRKKPGMIAAVRFESPGMLSAQPFASPQGAVCEFDGTRCFVRVAGGSLKMDDPAPRFEVWNELHQSWVGFARGDFLRIDDPADVYPIDYDTFCKTYEPLLEEDIDDEGTE